MAWSASCKGRQRLTTAFDGWLFKKSSAASEGMRPWDNIRKGKLEIQIELAASRMPPSDQLWVIAQQDLGWKKAVAQLS